MKFKVGDQVTVKDGYCCENCRDRVLTISEINLGGYFPIKCIGGRDGEFEIFDENHLELREPKEEKWVSVNDEITAEFDNLVDIDSLAWGSIELYHNGKYIGDCLFDGVKIHNNKYKVVKSGYRENYFDILKKVE